MQKAIGFFNTLFSAWWKKDRVSSFPSNTHSLLAETCVEAPCFFTTGQSKEVPLKRRMNVSHDGLESQLKKSSRRENKGKNMVRVKTKNTTEASNVFTRGDHKDIPVKGKRLVGSHEGPVPWSKKPLRKRSRTVKEERKMGRIKTNNVSKASGSTTKEEGKEVGSYKGLVSLSEEAPIRRRRNKNVENQQTKNKSRKYSEAVDSFSRKASKKSPIKRKRLVVSHIEPVLQSEETPGKKWRRKKEMPSQPVRRKNPYRKAKFFGRYTVEKKLGKGGFGEVYEGSRKTFMKKVAIKFVFKAKDDTYITLPGETRQLPREVALMELVCKPPHCPYVINLLEWFETPSEYILVLERPDACIDLHSYCRHERNRVSEPLAQVIMKQVIWAACHCRDRGVVHRDIKEENILLNPHTLEIKLIDFGCGDLLKDAPYEAYAGTFSPPEWIIRSEFIAEPSSVWGLAVLLYSLLCGRVPFYDSGEIVEGRLHFPRYLSEASCNLIRWCLEKDPRKRPTFEQILSHYWFGGKVIMNNKYTPKYSQLTNVKSVCPVKE